MRKALPLLALLPLLGGCAHRTAADSASPDRGSLEVQLEVENHNWSDIVIYLVRGTQAERLGTVTSLSRVNLVFPYRKLGNGTTVRLRAYPIGGRAAFTSESLLVQPGQTIRWTLENDLDRSFLAVF